MKSRFKEFPEFPEDKRECKDKTGNQRNSNMSGKLPGHFNAYQVEWLCVNAQSSVFNIKHFGQIVPKLAENPVCKEIRVLGSKNNFVENKFLKINATIINDNNCNTELIICHLSSSRCSRNDISPLASSSLSSNSMPFSSDMIDLKFQPVKMINLILQNNINL